MIRDGRPFSNTYKAVRGNAGGMDHGKAYTEGPDNSFDAEAPIHFSAFLTLDNIKYFLEYNFGKGLLNMPNLFGLAQEQPMKTDPKFTGIFNSGHTSKTGFLDPVYTYSESACDGSINTITFNTKSFVEKYEENANDIASVNVQQYMNISQDRGVSMNKLMMKLLNKFHHDLTKSSFKSIIDMTSKNYMFHLYQLSDKPNVSAEKYRGFMPNIRLYYYDALKSGKSIIHTMDDAMDSKENTIICNSDNAIDVHHDRNKFRILKSSAEFRKHPRDKNLHFKLQLWNENEPEIKKTIYIYPSVDKRRTKIPEFNEKEPEYWSKSSRYITLSCSMNILSKDAVDHQLSSIGGYTSGSDFQSADDFRGIIIQWAYRMLGKPYWPEKLTKDEWGFGAKRNANNPRCVISIKGDSEDMRSCKLDMVEALRIQSNKHNNKLDECDSMIRIALALTYGTLVGSYSNCTSGKNQNGRTTPWDLDEFVKEMKDRWIPQSKSEVKVSVTPPIASVTSYLTPTLPSTSNVIIQPIIQPAIIESSISFNNDTDNKKIKVMSSKICKVAIPYKGDYKAHIDSLKQYLIIMGDEKFIEYATERTIFEMKYL